jgi:Zn-dependent hydrolases, including glyoxylases
MMEQQLIRIDLAGVNCYLGKQGDTVILFDTGGHLFFDKQFDNRRTAIDKELQAHGCNKENLKLIVLTHGDNDHVCNAAYLREKYSTKLAMHPDDLHLVDSPGVETLMENCRYYSLLYKLAFVLMKNPIRKIIKKILDEFESFKPDILLDDGFDLSPYGFEATVFHTPGHTKGSIGILTKQGCYISGDTFSNTGRPGVAPNAWDFKTLGSSVRRIKDLKIEAIYPGHGNPFNAASIK